MKAIRDEEKAKFAKEGSEKVIQQQLNKIDEVDHEYESSESKKLSQPQPPHQIGKDEINILDQAVMSSFKKQVEQAQE